MFSQSDSCQCSLHKQNELRQIETQRHACYRALARTILGPQAPKNDLGLARALAEHARTLQPASNVINIAAFRAA
jgi:hypothetical protein